MFSKILIFLLLGLRPMLGPATCRFAIGCTDYAVLQLQEKPLFKALGLIFKRILSCNPLF